ncbi:MAG: hypothetical protein ABII00_07735 [Elusimicrobiota bacterium]
MQRARIAATDARKAWVMPGLLAFCLGFAPPLSARQSGPSEGGAARLDSPLRRGGLSFRGAAGGLELPSAGRRAMSQAAAIGAWEAARQAEGLDLRDAFNRPISRADLRRGLRAGSVRMIHEAARLSRLPGLRALLEYMDRAHLLAARLRAEGPGPARCESAVAAREVRSPKVHAKPVFLSMEAPDTASEFTLSPLQLTYAPGRLRVLPLLC